MVIGPDQVKQRLENKDIVTVMSSGAIDYYYDLKLKV